MYYNHLFTKFKHFITNLPTLTAMTITTSCSLGALYTFSTNTSHWGSLPKLQVTTQCNVQADHNAPG